MNRNIKKNKNLYVILLVIVTVIIIIVSLIISAYNKSKVKSEIIYVTNYSEFYTVDSCANRFVNALISKDANSVMKQLSKSYKKDNNIDISNVVEKFDIGDSVSYTSKQMKYQRLKGDITKYYIKGILTQEEYTDNLDVISSTEKDFYLIIYLNKNEKTFSVEAYDGQKFIEGDK